MPLVSGGDKAVLPFLRVRGRWKLSRPLRARPQDTVLACGDTYPPPSPQAPAQRPAPDPPWSPVARSLALPAERKQMFLQKKPLSHRLLFLQIVCPEDTGQELK